jgi:hypothetical protein
VEFTYPILEGTIVFHWSIRSIKPQEENKQELKKIRVPRLRAPTGHGGADYRVFLI